MRERFLCDGTQAKAPYFFEYPSVLALLLRDVRYGIQIRAGAIDVTPFGAPDEWVWSTAALLVAHSAKRVLVAAPIASGRPIRLTVSGLRARAWYRCTLPHIGRAPDGELDESRVGDLLDARRAALAQEHECESASARASAEGVVRLRLRVPTNASVRSRDASASPAAACT